MVETITPAGCGSRQRYRVALALFAVGAIAAAAALGARAGAGRRAARPRVALRRARPCSRCWRRCARRACCACRVPRSAPAGARALAPRVAARRLEPGLRRRPGRGDLHPPARRHVLGGLRRRGRPRRPARARRRAWRCSALGRALMVALPARGRARPVGGRRAPRRGARACCGRRTRSCWWRSPAPRRRDARGRPGRDAAGSLRPRRGREGAGRDRDRPVGLDRDRPRAGPARRPRARQPLARPSTSICSRTRTARASTSSAGRTGEQIARVAGDVDQAAIDWPRIAYVRRTGSGERLEMLNLVSGHRVTLSRAGRAGRHRAAGAARRLRGLAPGVRPALPGAGASRARGTLEGDLLVAQRPRGEPRALLGARALGGAVRLRSPTCACAASGGARSARWPRCSGPRASCGPPPSGRTRPSPRGGTPSPVVPA